MPFEPLKTSALARGAKGEEDPSEAQRQRFQRPSEHWYLPNRKVGKLEIEGKRTVITWKRFSILGIPMLG